MKPLDQSYSKSRRFKNQVKAVVTNPYNVIVLVAIVLLTYLIVLPLVDMLSTTFQLAQRDLRATGGTMADVGKFTLYYWQRLLASDLSWNLLFKPLLNSLTIGVGVSVCAIALGSILAWLMVRSDLPFKPFFSLAVIIPYMIPSWVKSQAWLSMFKTPRVGGAPGFIAALMMNAGISTERIEAILSPIAYGRLAIIIVLTLHYYAYTYLLVSAALNSINSELEEMGEIQGASKPLILRKITLPLVLPAMLSAVILTFSKAIGTFGTINYLGSPVSFRTLSSELYSNSKSQNTQTAFAMAILMICIASLSVFVNQRLIGARKSYATIGGKGGRSTPIGLGGWKPIATIILFIFFLVGIIMPVIILILESCMLKEGTYSLSNFTLYYWIGEGDPNIMEGVPGIFKNETFMMSLVNSLKLTLVNGVFGTIFGQMLGYICAKGRGKLHGKLVEQLVFIPLPDPLRGVRRHLPVHVLQASDALRRNAHSGPVRHLRPADADLRGQASALCLPRRYLQHAADQRRAGGGRHHRGRRLLQAFCQDRVPPVQGRLYFRLHADLRFHHEGIGSDHPDHDAQDLHAAVSGVPVPEPELPAGF